MRVSEKLELISKIGRELQSRFTFDELMAFPRGFEIPLPSMTGNSKWVYTKSALQNVPAILF